jgi:hypothetical protein
MVAHPRPLSDVFAAIPDFRQSRGKRHALSALCALACGAMLCGARRSSALAEWGRNDGTRLAQALGFTHATPCAATLQMIFRHVNRDECEAHVGAWADSVVESLPPAAETPAAAVALEGKTLRGSTTHGAPGMHLLAALAHHVGVTLAPQAVADKPNEMTAVETLWHPLVLEGRVMTRDARLTPRHVAQTSVDKGGDSVMLVQEHQPQLHAAIALVCAQPPWGDGQETVSTGDRGHGRIAQRTLTARTALAGRSLGPGLAQVFPLERQGIRKKTGEERSEVV